MTKEEEEKRRQEEEKKRRKELSEEEKQVRKFSKEKSINHPIDLFGFCGQFNGKRNCAEKNLNCKKEMNFHQDSEGRI